MATTTWTPGAQGNYLDPTYWSGGAPAPGDTAVIAGAGTSIALYAPGNDPQRFSPNPAPPGYVIAGETLAFQPDAAATQSSPVQTILSNSSLAADTALTTTGPGLAKLVAWFDNRLAGSISMAAGSGLRLTLRSDWPPGGVPPADDAGLPTTLNSGSIAIGPGAGFWLWPLVGGTNYQLDAYGNWVLVNPFSGFAFFTNTGRIALASGATFLDRGLSPSLGLYFHEFRNDGTIEAQGAAGRKTAIIMDANLVGGGTIRLDGGDSDDPSQTQLALFGPLKGGEIRLRNASFYLDGGENYARAYDSSITFEDTRSYVFLQPSLLRGPVPGSRPGTPEATWPSLIEPFGTVLKGFRPGNTIAIHWSFAGADDRFGTQWDRASGTLTVTSLTQAGATPVAQFRLEGDYAPDAFQASGAILGTGQEVPGYLFSPFEGKPAQIDITLKPG